MRWFDRKFVTLNTNLSFPGTMERLRGTPLRLEDLIRQIPSRFLQMRINGTGYMQENTGILLDLEPLTTLYVKDEAGNLVDMGTLKRGKQIKASALSSVRRERQELPPSF